MYSCSLLLVASHLCSELPKPKAKIKQKKLDENMNFARIRNMGDKEWPTTNLVMGRCIGIGGCFLSQAASFLNLK